MPKKEGGLSLPLVVRLLLILELEEQVNGSSGRVGRT
jgi:hypothetical protein